MDDWLWMRAAELGRAIGRGEIDPLALTRVHLDAIEAHPLSRQVYARVSADRALAEAAAASERARTGRRRSPLDGVPVSWKDLFDTAGIGTEAGTRMLAGRVPDRDAAVLRAATDRGLVCLGKTHMTEIAFSGLGVNPMAATPPNKNDAEAAPGGSSSGAAASVAFGLAPLAIGTDTGGSVRIPAAWNDLVGLKTTHGLLPLTGVLPLCESFDTVGPIGRSVEDCALALEALGGPRAPDLAGADLTGRRFLVVETLALQDLEPAPAAGFDAAVAALEAAGAEVDHAEWPDLEAAYAVAGPLYATEAWSVWREHVEAKGAEMFHQIRDRVSAGAEMPAHTYLEIWRNLRKLRRGWAEFTAAYDAVLSPATAILPPKTDRLIEDDAFYRDRNRLALRNTTLGNLMGLCSLSLPTGVPSCGILLSGRPGGEAALLRVGAAAERALWEA